MSKIGNFTPVQAPVAVGARGTANQPQHFACQWKSTEGLGGRASEMIAVTKLPAIQNATATVTVFQKGTEIRVGAPLSAFVIAGTLRAKWQVPINQKAGEYHFKVSVLLGKNTYVGKTTAALNVRTDGFIG